MFIQKPILIMAISCGKIVIKESIKMNTVFLVSEFSDPYEPPFQMAICTSLEEIMKLGLKNIWLWGKETNGETLCKDLITGEERIIKKYNSLPTPFLEEVKLNTLLIDKKGEVIKDHA